MLFSDYLRDHYGECRDPVACAKPGGCLHGTWLGRQCPNWIPTTARTWAELMEIARDRKEKAKEVGVASGGEPGTYC